MLSDLTKQPFALSLPGQRITLIGAAPELALPLFESICRDRTARGSSWVWLESATQLAGYLSKTSPLTPEKEVVYLIKKESSTIGTIHLHSLSYCDHKVEIGYAIEKSFEGFGYVSEAVALVEAELKRLKFNKIVINCSVANTRSVKVAERCGYRREGTLMSDCIEDGKFRDSALFGKIISF